MIADLRNQFPNRVPKCIIELKFVNELIAVFYILYGIFARLLFCFLVCVHWLLCSYLPETNRLLTGKLLHLVLCLGCLDVYTVSHKTLATFIFMITLLMRENLDICFAVAFRNEQMTDGITTSPHICSCTTLQINFGLHRFLYLVVSRAWWD